MIKINITDKLYPKSLKDIPNPPKQLYLEGNIDLLDSYSVSIIGSRNCSENGKKITAKFARELSSSGVTIVSGLALGIDTVAHTFSYDKTGKTIAVLGCGFNKIFPEENIELYKKILENDGLIVSEYPPDEEHKSKYFLERNRIVSGLSLGILVIEALYRSGTSVTARQAISQGRAVFAIPHEIWDSRGIGTNRLLKNGAILITDTSDILLNLKLIRLNNNYLKLKKEGSFSTDPDISILDNSTIVANNKFSNENHYNIYSMLNKTNKKHATIYNIIEHSISINSISVISANELSHKSGFSINEVLSILFMLEVDGYIKKVEGGYICT